MKRIRQGAAPEIRPRAATRPKPKTGRSRLLLPERRTFKRVDTRKKRSDGLKAWR
jgi:hypothetical protein